MFQISVYPLPKPPASPLASREQACDNATVKNLVSLANGWSMMCCYLRMSRFCRRIGLDSQPIRQVATHNLALHVSNMGKESHFNGGFVATSICSHSYCCPTRRLPRALQPNANLLWSHTWQQSLLYCCTLPYWSAASMVISAFQQRLTYCWVPHPHWYEYR